MKLLAKAVEHLCAVSGEEGKKRGYISGEAFWRSFLEKLVRTYACADNMHSLANDWAVGTAAYLQVSLAPHVMVNSCTGRVSDSASKFHQAAFLAATAVFPPQLHACICLHCL
jgi:hypothetical protein